MPNETKEIILDITDVKAPNGILKDAREAGVRKVLTRTKFPRAAELDGFEKIAQSDSEIRLTDPSSLGNEKTAAWVEINGSADIKTAVGAAEAGHGIVIAHCNNWVVIPLENLIAEFHGRGKRLYASIDSEKDLDLAFTILERGVDGVVISSNEFERTKERLKVLLTPGYKLVKAKVAEVRDVGLGDRACVDTTSSLSLGEGMLVGSKSSFFFLVHSETVPTEYIPTRQFRVNAGAIHSYVLGLQDRTNYLSELSSGDMVRTVSANGTSRTVAVGRVKIERRPLVMIVARAGEQEGSVILQKAETVRLVKADLSPVAVTDLAKGIEVLVYLAKASGRHFGGQVDEYIVER